MKCGESTPIGAGPSQGYGALPPKKGTKPTGKKNRTVLAKNEEQSRRRLFPGFGRHWRSSQILICIKVSGEMSAAVQVVRRNTGPDRYKITATAEFEASPAASWELLWDWERFVEVGLPGMTSDFTWLSGGPDDVPSTFQFEIAGALLKEEIYERTHTEREYLLRYRALEPALGVEEYDAVLRLMQAADGCTAFEAIRDVRLQAGTSPDMLSELVRLETQCLVDHFAP